MLEKLPKEITLLLFEDNKTAGTAASFHNEISRFFVLPEYQGRGYGRILLKELDMKEKWQFIRDINKYKRENGKLYLKNGLYFGIYERIYYSVPIGLSTSDKNFLEEDFCE